MLRRRSRGERAGGVRLAASLVALALGGLAAGCGAPEISKQRTNVLLIVVDTLRADHLSAWGYGLPTSPEIDALASQGVRFARYHSTSSWTRPGFATLLSGLYPRSAGIYSQRFDRLPDDVTTLPEILRAEGYETIGINTNPNLHRYFGFDQGFDSYRDTDQVWAWMRDQPGVAHDDAGGEGGKPSLSDARQTTDRALEALRDDRRSARSPWFMMVVYIDPHFPYQAPPSYARALAAASGEAGRSDKARRRQTPETLAYDAEIRFADEQIGRLLRSLKQLGELDDTLIVLTSDHGEGLGDFPGVPFGDRHGETLYDAITHVPLILQHPSLSARQVDELVGAVDLLPTLLGLLEVAGPAELPGRSLASLVREGIAPEQLAEFVVSESDWRRKSRVSLRADGWRYIDNASLAGAGSATQPGASQREGLPPREELYRREGRFERWRDSRADEEPERAARYRAALEAWRNDTPARPPINHVPLGGGSLPNGQIWPPQQAGAASDEALDPAVRSQLEALGYLED